MRPIDVADLYISAGDKDGSFEWMRRGFMAHDHDMVYMGVWPGVDSLRNDPRYRDLLLQMKLPE